MWVRNVALTVMLGFWAVPGMVDEWLASDVEEMSYIEVNPAQVEDCRSELQCWAARHAPEAVPICREAISEAVRKPQSPYHPSPYTGLDWTHKDGKTFRYIGWYDKEKGIIFYGGNWAALLLPDVGFRPAIYECAYDPATREAIGTIGLR